MEVLHKLLANFMGSCVVVQFQVASVH